MASTLRYRPGFGWVERYADDYCPITGMSHADTALWYDDPTCRVCDQSLDAFTRYGETLAVTS